MKKSIFFILPLLFAANISLAQNSILAGKIVDENNKPVGGALVQIRLDKTGEEFKMVSDNDGLYYSPLVPKGTYKASILENEKRYKAKDLYLEETDRLTKYYQIRLSGKNAEVSILEHNPFMQAALYKVMKDGPRIDKPGEHMMRVRIDSSGKLIPLDNKQTYPRR
jgi:hypothetical protein